MGADDSARLLGEDDEASAGAGEKDAQTSNPFAIIAFTWRGRFSAIMFVGLCLNYALRVIMSVLVTPIATEYNYSTTQQGYILSSFFAGYMLPQLMAGRLAARFGGHYIVLFSILVPSLLTALMPIASSSVTSLCVLRAFIGLTEGSCYPALHAVISEWAPAKERSMIVNIIWSGAFLGTALTLPIAGAIGGGTGFLSGWRACFILYGIMGCVWALLFWLLCSSSPETHPYISASERAYIVASRKDFVADAGTAEEDVLVVEEKEEGEPLVTLLPRLFSTPAVWSSIIGHSTHNFVFYLLLTELPSYMKTQLGFDLAKSGAIASVPYLACWAGSNIGGSIADTLIARGWPVINVRRLAFFCGEALPALALIATGYAPDSTSVIALLTIAIGLSGVSSAGYACTPLDIAPHLAGTIMGIQNTFGTVPGILAPLIVAAMTQPNDKAHWRGVFFMAASVGLTGCAAYCLLASATLDPRLAKGGGKEAQGGGEDGVAVPVRGFVVKGR